jgi:hypothetical protein
LINDEPFELQQFFVVDDKSVFGVNELAVDGGCLIFGVVK